MAHLVGRERDFTMKTAVRTVATITIGYPMAIIFLITVMILIGTAIFLDDLLGE